MNEHPTLTRYDNPVFCVEYTLEDSGNLVCYWFTATTSVFFARYWFEMAHQTLRVKVLRVSEVSESLLNRLLSGSVNKEVW